MKTALWIITMLASLLAAESRYTNALIDAQSPYLRQHAHNPVNWHAWNDESFEKAKKEDKLIFLSIGYSTCHWCHVMEKESFEDETIAALLNQNYISIKVDKEEMPHIDIHYQQIHSYLKEGRNGWPLSVIMTSRKEILFIATYIPPKDDYGIEGMHTLLPKYAKLYHEDKTRLTKLISANQALIAKGETIPNDLSDTNLTKRFVTAMEKRYDRVYKGFDKRPRFPLASHLRYLLEIYRLENNENAYKMVKESMHAMANGGIYDQVEGAFFRYSVDQDWIIPHFEKMLYTTAELAPLYTKLYMMTDNPRYKAIVIESIDESTRRFGFNNLFYAASDADSDGEEGRYFVYEYEVVKKALQKADYNQTEIDENLEYYDIFETGNFEHGLSQPHTNTGFDTPPKRFEETKAILKKLRADRTYPFIDQKIITSWNAMMITALFDASTIEPRYADQALTSLEALLKKHYLKGTLYHQSLGNHPPVQKALLEDYAYLAEALVSAYEKTYEKRYLQLAREIIESAKAKFYREDTWYLDDTAFRAKTTYEDRYYTAPLPKLLHAMLSVSYLQYDLKLLQETKGYIEKEKPRILAAFDASPEALRLLTRVEKRDIVLKSTKVNLIQNADTIANIRYPYLLRTTENTNMYLLCDEKTCFFYDKNLTKVIEQIK